MRFATQSALAGFLVLACLACASQQAFAKVQIDIDVGRQQMTVSNERGERYVWPVSTGRKGYRTPRGEFRPQSLRKMHYSRKYAMAPMPHSIFFHGGFAIHGTDSVRQLGRPASHGCIRLAPRAAARLFAMVKKDGARIRIAGTAPMIAGLSDHGRSVGALQQERIALGAPNALVAFSRDGTVEGQYSEATGFEFLEILSSDELADIDSGDEGSPGDGLDAWTLRSN